MLKDLFTSSVYVRVRRNHLRLRHVGKHREIELSAPDPFTTRRLLIGEFSRAERLLAEGLQRLHSGLFSPSPMVVIHPLEMVEDGLSPVETQAFRELAAGAGARRVLVWTGHELSDAEVLARIKEA